MQGLGDVLSQQDKNGKNHVIAYASWSLWFNEQLIQNYGSVNLEVLALEWVVMEKVRDYLLGSNITTYTDNNPLTYIKGTKLGTAQI